MEKTRQQYIAGLRKLADVLTHSDLPMSTHHNLYVSVADKDELLRYIRTLGGILDKSIGFGGDDIHLKSRTMPIMLSIPRDKVCRKTVTYDCEPMFSPDDEKELDAAALGVGA